MAESKAIVGQFDVCLEDDDTIRTASKLGKKIMEGVYKVINNYLTK